MQTHRICSRCKDNLEISHFELRSDRKDLTRSICRKCCRLIGREWYQKNKEKVKQNNREHYLANPAKAKLYSHNWRANNPARRLIQGAAERARNKSLKFDLTQEDISIPEFCPVFGMKLIANSGGKRTADCSPSIDRIDPSKGYVKGNVCVISHRANTIKNDGTIEEHQKVIDYMKSKLS